MCLDYLFQHRRVVFTTVIGLCLGKMTLDSTIPNIRTDSKEQYEAFARSFALVTIAKCLNDSTDEALAYAFLHA